MIVAEQKRQENIVEYLLYMWQVEDLIRANALDSDRTDAALSAKQGKALKELIDAGSGGGGGGSGDSTTVNKIIAAITLGNWNDHNIQQGEWDNVLYVPKLDMLFTCDIGKITSETMTPYATLTGNGKQWISSSSKIPHGCAIGWSPEFDMLCMIGKDKAATVPTSGVSINAWTQIPIASSNQGYIRSICWSPTLKSFCGVGDNGRVVVFDNKTSWTEYTIQQNPDMTNVIWCQELGLLCATAKGGKIFTSPDGKTWTLRNTPTTVDLLSCCWSQKHKLFCAVGGNKVITSTDMTTWEEHTVEIDNLSGVCWSLELGVFCAVSRTNKPNVGYGLSSPDGKDWTVRRLPAGAWSDVYWSSTHGTFCVVGTNKVMMSFSLPL